MAIYMWRDMTLPWIYWSSALGLISLVDNDWNVTTISDKNLWATQVYNSWDTLSEANAWKFYQWGNNYGFPFTWSVTTSSTQVNASTYWPWNYYNSSTFITISSNTWDSSNNQNLRWWTTWTNAAMKWPCAEWYHIPTDTETTALKTAFEWLWLSWWPNFSKYLKMPLAWYRDGWISSATNIWTSWSYWTSIYRNSTSSYRIYFTSSSLYPAGSTYTTFWCSIRPFANTPTQPDDSRTVLYQPN